MILDEKLIIIMNEYMDVSLYAQKKVRLICVYTVYVRVCVREEGKVTFPLGLSIKTRRSREGVEVYLGSNECECSILSSALLAL
jgi:hypothetical protein